MYIQNSKLNNYDNINHYVPNNFDLIRLFAALQVMITNHYDSYFDIGIGSDFWCAFSGVPIFLLLTGFFIPMSFEHNPRIGQFLFNRLLKIVPEMYASIILAVMLMFATGYAVNASFPSFFLWVISYMIYPLYTPDYLRGYGVGALNGALWIIPVQITFYLMLPILYKLFNFETRATLKIILLCVLFAVLKMIVIATFHKFGIRETSVLFKVYTSSIFVHFPMLLIGMLLYKNFDVLIKIVRNRFLLFLAIHLALYYTFAYFEMEHSTLASASSWTKLPLMITLSLCVFSAGYTLPELSGKILHGYDISYALYVYHMPVANFILYTIGIGSLSFMLSFILVVIVSVVSKYFIENPFLKLKKNTLRKY